MSYLGLPLWAQYLSEGILIFAGFAASAVVLTRLRYSPYLAFLLVLPCVNVVALWALAFSLWSAERVRKNNL